MTLLAAEPPAASSPSGGPENTAANQPKVAAEVKSRWTLSRLWPIGFALWLSFFYHMVFIDRHCLPLLLTPVGRSTNPHFDAGLAQAIVFHVAQALFLYCYFRCMFIPPGGIPDTPEWKFIDDESCVPFVEWKSCGDRRYCRWCAKFKPDRTHHCRSCRSCVLKMDHHCAWTNNCIGFHNNKAFLLCIFYTFIGVDLVAVAHLSSDPYEYLFPESAAFSMAVSVFFALFAAFLTFACCIHVYLVGFAYTSLEFRERIWNTETGKSPYDKGFYHNICAVLGENPLLWLIPVLNSPGEGINWCQKEGEGVNGGYGGQRDGDPLLLNDSSGEAPLKTTNKGDFVHGPGGSPDTQDGDDSGDGAETRSDNSGGTGGHRQTE